MDRPVEFRREEKYACERRTQYRDRQRIEPVNTVLSACPGPEAFAGLVTAPVFKTGEAFATNAWWVRFPSASASPRAIHRLIKIDTKDSARTQDYRRVTGTWS